MKRPDPKPAPLFELAGIDAREQKPLPLATRYREATSEPTIMDWIDQQPRSTAQ